jgi:hypothetical protein
MTKHKMKITPEEAMFDDARRQIMALCHKSFEEGREKQNLFNAGRYGSVNLDFNKSKIYKIIMNLKSINEQIIELLLKGNK